jgi:dTDP-4-dehydrorhamnose reductase
MKLLITGGTSLVGSNIIRVAQEKYDVELAASLFQKSPASPWDFQTVAIDLEDPASITRAIEDVQPDCVIHCAAVRDEDRLEWDHEWGWRLMVDGTEVLARECQRIGAKLVFLSSCWTFGNRGDPPYSEDSSSCPANYFGLLKTVGETLVRSLCDNYAIARLSGIQGINWSAADFNLHHEKEGIGVGSLANYFWYRLSRSQPVVVWSERYSQFDNPIVASDLADMLLIIATGDHQGIFHTCGRDSVSRLELARLVAEVFEYDQSFVRPATPEEMDYSLLEGVLPAPSDSRLQFAESEARLGNPYPSLVDGLQEFRRQVEQVQRG